MQLSIENMEKVTLARCGLYDYLSETVGIISHLQDSLIWSIYKMEKSNGGDWRNGIPNGLRPVAFQGSSNFNGNAKQVRDEFCSYFSSEEGSVSWQENFKALSFCLKHELLQDVIDIQFLLLRKTFLLTRVVVVFRTLNLTESFKNSNKLK